MRSSRRSLWAALGASALMLSSAGCTRQNRKAAAAIQHPPKAAKQAVVLAMERQITNAIDAGEGDAIVRQLRHRVSEEPDNIAARLELASHYQNQGAYELAIEHLRIAASRQPDSEDSALRLSRALRANSQSVESIAVLVRFSETHPAATAALLEELAIAEDENGALNEGERFHRAAIAAGQRDDKLRNNLGYNFMQQGKYADAAHEFRAALSLNPVSEAARNNLGFALARMDQPQEALLQWSSISGPAAAHNNLAAVLIEKRDYAGARKEIEAALQFDRHSPAALKNLQLVAELDGKAPSFTMNSMEANRKTSGWARVSSAVNRILFGETSPKNASQQAAARIASQ